MARNYAISGTRAVSSPTKTLLALTGGTTTRPVVFDVLVGSTATPADNALEFILQRYTAAGTSTSVTPTALDSGDPAAIATAGANHTVEPTYSAGAVLIDLAMNQRATQRWVPSPGREIKLPATANYGVGLQPVHASFTGNVTATIWFED
jgi:hypothetical protein